MTDRFWGEDKDREAARQLGLEGDHTIFMMGITVDHIEDVSDVAHEFKKYGYVYAHEVLEAVAERVHTVELPKGFVIVGMLPIGADDPKTFGIVDFTMFGRK